MVRSGVDSVVDEVAGALELISDIARIRRDAGFNSAVVENRQRPMIQVYGEVLTLLYIFRVRHRKESIVQADLSRERV